MKWRPALCTHYLLVGQEGWARVTHKWRMAWGRLYLAAHAAPSHKRLDACTQYLSRNYSTLTVVYEDYCTHPHAKSPFCRCIAPRKRLSLVFPQIPPLQVDTVQRRHSTNDIHSSSISLFLLSTACQPRSLPPSSLLTLTPLRRRYSHPVPSRPPTQSSTLVLDPPRHLPSHFANTRYPNQPGPHRQPLPCQDATPGDRRSATTLDKSRLHSTSIKDEPGTRTRTYID